MKIGKIAYHVICQLLFLTGVAGWWWWGDGDGGGGCKGQWEPWSSCSATCGGGRRYRYMSCVEKSERNRQYGRCNTKCYKGDYQPEAEGPGKCECYLETYGSCCESCPSIPHCSTGQVECKSKFNSRCKTCNRGYYSTGWSSDFYAGCLQCTHIPHCVSVTCTSQSDSRCEKCENDKIFYKKTHQDTQCERKCAWNHHYCWPGRCSDDLVRGCTCAKGFHKIANSRGTKCQLDTDTKPSLETCEMVAVGPGGKRARSNPNKCKDKKDFFGNFSPHEIAFSLTASFTIDQQRFQQKPDYIVDTKFGITDTSVLVIYRPLSGGMSQIAKKDLKRDIDNSTSAVNTDFQGGTISLSEHLSDGDRICLRFLARGGGYLRSKDMTDRKESNPEPFDKREVSRDLCYWHDVAPPRHCAEDRSCPMQPVSLSARITRSEIIYVNFSGWFDPNPKGGITNHASGIDFYDLQVNEVSGKNLLTVGTPISALSKVLNSTTHSVALNISSPRTRLYSIKVGVKDIADNVRSARRFVLFDKDSKITTDDNFPFYVSSASNVSNHIWQTNHGDVCLKWESHFLNKDYYDNDFLSPIKSDLLPPYEQTIGILPVTGTRTVYGISEFIFYWIERKQTNNRGKESVPNFLAQNFCKNLSMFDGAEYTLTIEAKDIINNTFQENRTVYVDRSGPTISNIWLTKDGQKSLYIHNTKDLTKMNLQFEAYDEHSGIKHVMWAFSASEYGSDLQRKSESVHRIPKENCSAVEYCYCPVIGSCEKKLYLVSPNSLKASNGDHNRNYFFTIRATNNALLSNTEHFDILVDESPPSVGGVYEGPSDSPDIDFTSDDSILVHWHGFFDHESGIRQYRIALSDQCLNKEKLLSFSGEHGFTSDIEGSHTSIRVPLNFTGKRYFSVLAFNNAMDPSEVACSDGITRDILPPKFKNISIENAKSTEQVFCLDKQPWMLNNNLKRIPLPDTTSCLSVCEHFNESFEFLLSLPKETQTLLDDDTSNFLCENLKLYNANSVVLLPNDHIFIQWNAADNLSQMSDFFVGFGTDISESLSPDIVKFKSTKAKNFFKQRHVGIEADALFYIHLKAINKAGIENVLTIGPILIDETPPLKVSLPQVNVQRTNVVFGWDKNTFVDNEQSEQINHIDFQFVSSARQEDPATPLMQWRLDTSKACVNFSGGCIKYPIEKLQSLNKGYEFYIDLIVYNNAGHFVELKTDAFLIPSMKPPGHAKIFDLDPADSNWESSDDIDAHFSEKTVCAKWSGFMHDELVHLQLGVGTQNNSDEIIPFRYVSDLSHWCITSDGIPNNVALFINAKATCSGGTTLSSSDGITIFNKSSVLDLISVFDGPRCSDFVKSLTTRVLKRNISTEIVVTEPLILGQIYTLHLKGIEQVLGIFSTDILVRASRKSKYGHVFEFVPFNSTPTMVLKHKENQTFLISLLKCALSLPAQFDTNAISANWVFDELIYNLSFTLETAIVHIKCRNTSNFSCIEFVSSWKTASSQTESLHDSLTLRSGQIYGTAVRMCLKSSCSGIRTSKGVVIDSFIPTGRLHTPKLDITDKSHLKLNIKWNSFLCHSEIVFYQWCLAADNIGNHLMKSWNTITDTSDSSGIYYVTEEVDFRILPYRPMFACVRAFALSGNVGLECSKISVLSDSTFDRNVVYDMDTSQSTWNTVLQLSHSSHLGNFMSLLHDAELNFGSNLTSPGAVVLHGIGREIIWYLVTSPIIPTTCSQNPYCVMESSTRTGYVNFNKAMLMYDVMYFICATSNATFLDREHATEALGAFTSCSNGFLIDDKPPTAGKVYVEYFDGYISSTENVVVKWTAFTDITDAQWFGYPDNIESYSVAVGLRPGNDDLVKFYPVGLETIWTIPVIQTRNGDKIFICVKGKAHSGLSTIASSQGLIVDRTPPLAGEIDIGVSSLQSPFVNSKYMKITFHGFTDAESGIDHFEIGIGTFSDRTDIVASSKYYSDQAEVPIESLSDGHTYYIIARAVNRAGLASRKVSQFFKVDKSLPQPGRVSDGQSEVDEDYSNDLNMISGYWQGFSDPHSNIGYYEVGLGTMPFSDNIRAMINVGLRQEYKWKGDFEAGEKYYITVKACNGASLCIERASNGLILDNSPPIPGIVRIGNQGRHKKFVHQRFVLQFQWIGFSDPQSGIRSFDACIGTQPYKCNIERRFNCYLASSFMKVGINLPEKMELYVTVTALNKAGLNATRSSDSFQVDSSPPVLTEKPVFVTDYNSVSTSVVQWEKSVLRATWKFEDKESSIVRHVVSLKTHHEGHTPLENIELGPENKLTATFEANNWLSDGDKYRLIVTACNAAGSCSTSETDDLMIDSTAPHRGGFAIPMYWENFKDEQNHTYSNVSIRWTGFSDQESGLKRYFVTFSRSYSGSELFHGLVNSTPNYNEADFVSSSFILEDAVFPGDRIITTIWAENNVGLKNSMLRLTLMAVSSMHDADNSLDEGTLEIQKHSCDIHYCTKDCTCAVVNMPCVDVEPNMSCRMANPYEQIYPQISVYGGPLEYPSGITASSACLAGHWNSTDSKAFLIKRFEWSMGLRGQPFGSGIFDLKTERVWHDIGLRSDITHCLSTGRHLVHAEEYQIHVRAWYAPDIYSIFSSAPILVDQTPPQITRGRNIKDSDLYCLLDYDVISWTDKITVCWESVFYDAQSQITNYLVGLGTSPQMDDIYSFRSLGLHTILQLTNLTLSHGTKYFFSVSAYNGVGLHTTLSSDGFIIDTDEPQPGTVFNTIRHKNAAYQSTTKTFEVSWHGFVDHFSGIRNYYISLVEEKPNTSQTTFINVGLMTSYQFSGLALESGKSYKALVKAEDSSGHFSNIAESYPRMIDTTPPEPFECSNRTRIYVESFTVSSTTITLYLKQNSMYIISGLTNERILHPRIHLEVGSHQLLLPSALNHDGSRSFEYNFLPSKSGSKQIKVIFDGLINITGYLHIDKCDIAVSHALNSSLKVQQIAPNLIAVNVMLVDLQSLLHKVEVGAGTTKGSFQIRPLTQVYGNNGVIEINLPHSSTIHVTAVAENNAGLRTAITSEPIVLDHTPPIIKDIASDLKIDFNVTRHNINTQAINVSVRTIWKAEDLQSGIKLCFCGVGTRPYPTSKTIYRPAEQYVCEESITKVYHGTLVYSFIKCINAVELATLRVSAPQMVSFGSPDASDANIEFIPVEPYSYLYFAHKSLNKHIGSEVFVQTNKSSLNMQWSGFKDMSGLKQYEYRVLQGNVTLIDWTSVGHRTHATVDGLDLMDGAIYSADVRATNFGNVISRPITAYLMATEKAPKLSDRAMKVTSKENTVSLDWHDVFDVDPFLQRTFSLTVGSRSGYSDIIDIPYTNSEAYEFLLPEVTSGAQSLNEIYISVQCMYQTGLSSRKDTVYNF